MLNVIALIPLLSIFAPQVDMALSLKPGDKLTYDLSVKSTAMGLDAKGRMPLSVTKRDGNKITASWPQVEFTATKGSFQPIQASTCVLTDRGKILQGDARGQGTLFLMQMALPEQPISVGGTFKVAAIPGAGPADLTGKIEKLSDDGALATIVVDGLMGATGGQLALHWESQFDVKRGIFRSGSMTMSSPASKTIMSQFGFKLME